MTNATPAHILDAFQVHDGHPLYKAMLDVLDHAIEAETARVVDPRKEGEQAAYCRGALGSLMALRDELGAIHQEANSPKETA